MYVVKRPINGIGINGDEYLLNEDGSVMEFASHDEALLYLMENGFEPEYAKSLISFE